VSSFYLAAGVFIIVALLFVFYPWLRKKGITAETTLSNKSLIKQRLNELVTEQQQGLLSDTDRLQSENELKLALLDEVKTSHENTDNVTVVVLVGAVISLSVGIAVYWYANQIQQISNWQSAQQQTSELGQKISQGDKTLQLQDLQTFALGLRTKLVDTPEDATGWMLLGRVSGALNRLDSAIQAFEKSLQFEPNNIGTLSSYAQSLLMTGQEEQVLHSKRVLLRILSLEPDNTNAMGVLAVVASELNDPLLALKNWQQLLGFIPKNDANYPVISQRIIKLQVQLGQLANSNADSTPSSVVSSSEKNTATRVSITVKIGEDLQDKLPKNGYLFVFAQESSGKVRMPAAVVKMPLGDFPVVIELSDKNAMMPNYTLSQLEQAKLVARISIDENVVQSPGDMQGEWMATLSQGTLTEEIITIDRVLE
jgi:cytochrome c-type biogenesis protein CcmI